MDQFAVYFKAVCGGTVSGRSAFGVRRSAFGVRRSAFGVRRLALAARRALFTDGTYGTHGTNVMVPRTLKPGVSSPITDYCDPSS